MRKLSIIISLVTTLIFGVVIGANFEFESIIGKATEYAAVFFAAALFFLVVVLGVLWTGIYLAKRWVKRKLNVDTGASEADIVEGLVAKFTSVPGINPVQQIDQQKAVLINIGLWLARREAIQFSFNASVTVIGGLIGGATLLLLYQQNQKIEEQNARINLQTDASIVQGVLLEGARRASLSADKSSLFTDIRRDVSNLDRECADEDEMDRRGCWSWVDDSQDLKNFFLSSEVHERVKSFADRNTPYRLSISKGGALDFERPLRYQLDFPDLSPERGQLLETLTRERVFVGNYIFYYSQLSDFDLDDAFLMHASLHYADLQDATLVFADLREASLLGADLRDVNLSDADLFGVNFNAANLTSAFLEGAHISQASFEEANLTYADFRNVWAWSDWPPTGLPENLEIYFCDFRPEKHDRHSRPRECRN